MTMALPLERVDSHSNVVFMHEYGQMLQLSTIILQGGYNQTDITLCVRGTGAHKLSRLQPEVLVQELGLSLIWLGLQYK